jgi:hypothetical protein
MPHGGLTPTPSLEPNKPHYKKTLSAVALLTRVPSTTEIVICPTSWRSRVTTTRARSPPPRIPLRDAHRRRVPRRDRIGNVIAFEPQRSLPPRLRSALRIRFRARCWSLDMAFPAFVVAAGSRDSRRCSRENYLQRQITHCLAWTGISSVHQHHRKI